MKRLLLMGLALALWVSPAWSASERAAMITDALGGVRAVVAGRESSAGALLVLAPDDRLRLSQGARVSLIFFDDGHRETAIGPCEVRLTCRGGELISGGPSCLKADSPPGKVRLLSGGESLQTMGGHVAREAKLRLTMKHALTDTPRFTWENAAGLVRVAVFDPDDLTHPIWTSQPGASGIDYEGPALKPDTFYYWEVQETGARPGPGANFLVLSELSRAQVRAAEVEAEGLSARDPEDATPHVLMMALYADHYLVEEAIRAGRRALAVRPDDPALHLALHRLLLEVGDAAGARAEREEASRLERQR